LIDAAMHKEMLTALQWYADNGVHEITLDEAQDYTVLPATPPPADMVASLRETMPPPPQEQATPAFLGKSDARVEAIKLAKSANTLEELKEAIAGFDGIGIKKTASNLVFADGNPKAKIMVIGEAPGADEDREGKSFAGACGHLLDKILACIDLSRSAEDASDAVYLSNILNWRPPGNRTPSPAEIEVSLPFIERHIQLIQPDLLILFGAISAKSLLASDTGISRLRRTSHEYKTLTQDIGPEIKIPAFPTYHPQFLLSTPIQKRAVWEDMLKIKRKMQK
jgi:uracil-DNA glycosylase family 4